MSEIETGDKRGNKKRAKAVERGSDETSVNTSSSIADDRKESPTGSFEPCEVQVSFDIRGFTEDSAIEDVSFYLRGILPDRKNVISWDVLVKSLRNEELTSLIYLSETVDDASSCSEVSPQCSASTVSVDSSSEASGLVALLPVCFTHRNKECISTTSCFEEREISRYLAAYGCNKVCEKLKAISTQSSENTCLYFMLNHRAAFMPNQVAYQTLLQLFDTIIKKSWIKYKDIYIFTLLKARRLSQGGKDIMASKRRRKSTSWSTGEQNSQATTSLDFEFVRPEDEIFYKYGNSLTEVRPNDSSVEFAEEYPGQPTIEVPFAIPVLIPLVRIKTNGARKSKDSKSGCSNPLLSLMGEIQKLVDQESC